LPRLGNLLARKNLEKRSKTMKTIISTILALAVASSPLIAGQEPDIEKDKQKQEQPKKQPAKNPQAKPSQEPQSEDNPKPKPGKPKPEPAPPPKQQSQAEKQEQQTEKERQKQQEKQQKEQAKERNKTQTQRQTTESNKQASPQGTRGKGQKIPQEKFRANFGTEHHFRIARRDDRRFQYGGYWFEVVEVWPAGWSFDDECYIEEDGDDYYLVDIVRPQIRVLVIVVS
jgi:outer membrane biosynthesis protein TonB